MKIHQWAAMLGLAALLSAAPGWAAKRGDRMPEFSAPSLDGSDVSSVEIADKVAVICFWASWGKHCAAELRDLEVLEKELKDKRLVLLAVNEREEPARVSEFLAANQLALRVLLDTGPTARAFGVNGLPDLVVVSGGVVRERIVGYGPGDRDKIRRALRALLTEAAAKKLERPPAAAALSEIPPPLRAYAHLQLGAAHINIGDAFVNAGLRDGGHYAEAAKELHAGLALEPKNLELNVWLGVALERSGQPAEAIRQYRTALAIDPTNEYALEGLRRLAPTPPPPPAAAGADQPQD